MLKLIDNKTIVEKVVKQITDAIIEGELKPGNKIPTETELMQKMGIGRNSIREAIKMLSAMGILEIHRGDGTYITKNVSHSFLDPLLYSVMIEQSSIEEIVELRELLEVDILELALNKVTEDDINKIKELLKNSDEAFMQKDFDKMASIDLKFHYALIDIARNSILAKMAKGIMQLLFSSIKKTLINYESLNKEFNKSHKDIVDLLVNNDRSKIKSVVSKSLEGWRNYVK